MYPLTLVRISRGHPIHIEMINGEIYEGVVIRCDLNMNVYLKDVKITHGNQTYKCKESMVRGSFVKNFKVRKYLMDFQEKKKI